ncbi:AraC family transcriptional regulator [Erysipelotrichaceae bacterium Oil+RF-744-GAM-WT-6]|uniref:AraC family transcriptional regulator n=2 Tax=Stecheria intestinalis TaxID=2606630 RepID=A0A7X2NT26_9FIRM|nr:AraC family transcriptional regulator [Stecheria intestinalis]
MFSCQNINMKKNAEENYSFGNLPVFLENKEICSADPHQELAHWHDMLELIQVESGEMHCHVNDSDFLLKKGDICIINQEQVHRVYSTEEEKPCSAHTLTVNPMMLSSIHDLYNELILPVISDGDFTHIRMNGRNSHARMISDLMDELRQLAEEKPAGYELQALAYVSMILRQVYLVHMNEPIEQDHDEDLRLQKKMTTYIYEHYADRIGLNDIASSAGISRSKCAAVFSKYTETSPIDFLNSYRLEMSAAMLKNTNDSISSIAFSCGFSQQSYFNRMFLREYGMTPKEYRKSSRA